MARVKHRNITKSPLSIGVYSVREIDFIACINEESIIFAAISFIYDYFLNLLFGFKVMPFDI